MIPEQIIKRPLVLTEKGNALREAHNQYLFAVETLFSVKVVMVHTMIVRGRMRRMGRGREKTQNWKKAIVSLKAGETIDFFEGA